MMRSIPLVTHIKTLSLLMNRNSGSSSDELVLIVDRGSQHAPNIVPWDVGVAMCAVKKKRSQAGCFLLLSVTFYG